MRWTHAKVGRGLAALLVLALAGAACGDDTAAPTADSETTQNTADSPAQPQDGGTVTYVIQSDRQSLDPATIAQVSEAASISMYFNVYGALLYAETDGTVSPLLAESIDTPDDGMTWVLTLQPGMEFSDGTPFDADAVVANWTRLANPETGSPALGVLISVEGFEATDAQTVNITLKAPNSQFPGAIAHSALSFIASPTAIEAAGEDFGNQPVGGGPYLLEEWVRNDHSTWTPNPSYLYADEVHLDELVVRPITDETQKANTFTSGTAQLVWTGTRSTVRAIEQAGGELTPVTLVGNNGILMNVSKAPFDDPTMREALLQAIDRDALATATMGEPSEAPDGFSAEGSPIYNPDAKYTEHDPEAAQAKFDAYTAEHGDLDLSFIVLAGAGPSLDMATVLKEQLDAYDGVSLTLNAVEPASYLASFQNPDWTLGLWGIVGVAPDTSLWNTLHSTGFTNWSKYSNPDVDAAFEAARATSDAGEQLAAYQAAQQALVDDSYFPPVLASSFHLGATADLHVEAVYDGMPRTDLLWLEQ